MFTKSRKELVVMPAALQAGQVQFTLYSRLNAILQSKTTFKVWVEVFAQGIDLFKRVQAVQYFLKKNEQFEKSTCAIIILHLQSFGEIILISD